MKLVRLFIGAAALFIAGNAGATTVIKTYSAISSFQSGPNAVVSSTFTLTYNPALSSSSGAVTSFTSNGGAGFSPANINYYVNTNANGHFIAISGANGGQGVAPGITDFFISFGIDLSGDLASVAGSPIGIGQTYYQIGSNGYNDTSTLVSQVAVAVPEPTSWAMMIGGFGVAGGALRRRRKVATEVSFAV